jgi:membrane-bound serine protease (ClpP class)
MSVLRQADGRIVKVQGRDRRLATRDLATDLLLPDWRQRLLAVVTEPSFALVLLMIGFYGLILEASSPGFGVPGIAGVISLVIALFALQMLPVNYAGVALILLGMALLVAELLTPSFGVLGTGGVLAFVAGGLLLFERGVPGFSVSLPLILGVAMTFALLVLGGGSMALRARRRPVVCGQDEMQGAIGRVVSLDLNGQAWAEVQGERWKVRLVEPASLGSATAGLEPGQRVQVLATHGLILDVQRIHDSRP